MVITESLALAADQASSDNLNRIFLKQGLVQVKNLVPEAALASYREHLSMALRARLTGLGLEVHPEASLDDLFNRLCQYDRALGDQFARLGRDFPDFYAMIGLEPIQRVVAALMPTPLFQVVYDISLFRIDPPGDDRRNFDWHYDYPYNMMSQNAVTVWIPLTDVTPEMGQLYVVPGSHQRIWDVTLNQQMLGGKGSGHKAFSLTGVNSEELLAQSVQLSVKAGDALFLHSCLLHCSGRNRSNVSRWVFNPRYGNLLDPAIVDRGWSVTRMNNPLVFQAVHPEHCIEITG